MNSEAIYTLVGRRIRDLREKKKVSQDDLCKRISLARSSIANIERGRQRVMLHTLCEIAAALESEIHDLLPPLSELRKDEAHSAEEISNAERSWVEKLRIQAKSTVEK